MFFHPQNSKFEHLDPHSQELMRQTIAFFEEKGKAALKRDYHALTWYEDFVNFNREKGVFASLLTREAYGDGVPSARWDTARICDMNEILAFYGLPYWYAWQVSILGLGPIWMSENEQAKQKAARDLANGELFAFGLSERQHGADLYASEMQLKRQSHGGYLAKGEKYYIGNGNVASMVSTFGIDPETKEYVFFAVDSRRPEYELVKNIVAWQGYVAEYRLADYPVAEADLLARGNDAWDASLNTVNIGKFNLGWASIGICTHALYEAVTHAAHRRLYHHLVTDFPHVRRLLTDATCRLFAMRAFASRARDYFRSASLDDRRYLLFNPLVKMKVTMEGENVVNLLWDVIAAKGFEADTYFEMAAKEIRALPKLEGTVHVNMALVVKFMANYLFAPKTYPEIPRRMEAGEDHFLFHQGPTRGLGRIQFGDYHSAYQSYATPNVAVFQEQMDALKGFLMKSAPDEDQKKDIDFLLILGELFTLVVYGQLVLENAKLDQVPTDLIDRTFHVFIRDFNEQAIRLMSHKRAQETQVRMALAMIRRPVSDDAVAERVWEQTVMPQVDHYVMKP
jgi:acyl-CoA dehydrogenase